MDPVIASHAVSSGPRLRSRDIISLPRPRESVVNALILASRKHLVDYPPIQSLLMAGDCTAWWTCKLGGGARVRVAGNGRQVSE